MSWDKAEVTVAREDGRFLLNFDSYAAAGAFVDDVLTATVSGLREAGFTVNVRKITHVVENS